MSKNSSGKYNQQKQREAPKKFVTGIKIFLKKSKTKRDNMVESDIKFFLNMKNKGQFSLGKSVEFGKIKPLHK